MTHSTPALALGVSLLAAALGGCGGAVPLTFDLAALPPTGRTSASARSVTVAEPVGIQPFEADRIIVREPGGALSFLGGAQWADRLPRLIQTRLIQSLENSGRLKSVSRPGDKIVSDFQLISEIRAFDIAAGSGEAVVDLSAKIVAEGTGKVVSARVFTARIPVAKVDVASAAVGLDAALARVLGEMVVWVNSGR
ncbi:MAG: ABC-type transport auxiliary lipoprotein family protein [Methylobacterium sp.]|jgi:cholesterol transport system auxiliary component|uniref:ABC-type transport auxiliary lipoprotein family protein n=1 Tax=unclassified Methylobacterium TaxID=2615210 RepID=UPI0006FF7177|nr:MULTISPECIES: ABC-type transport auxiliary lipoprotein family protein [unclassified Methylobacterium]KQP08029.1 ABC transporter [Methylobacterium sp. Leaf99]MDO9426720.1 ABC-type transport auxiliary lipoprotein family protein [Methylobacterium sp.]